MDEFVYTESGLNVKSEVYKLISNNTIYKKSQYKTFNTKKQTSRNF